MAPHPLTALVVLAGGTSRRWAGQDKTAALLSGRPVLAHVVLTAAATQPLRNAPIVVVAPQDHPARALLGHATGTTPPLWVLEDPPDGGPVAGLAVGLAAALEALPEVAVIVVLAGDLPFAAPAVPRLLGAVARDADGALGVDPDGRRQPLLAAYRVPALRRALLGETRGRSLKSVVAQLSVTEVAVSARESLDLDTPQDLVTAAQLMPRS